MGLDVNLYAIGFSNEQLEAANAFFKARITIAWEPDREPTLRRFDSSSDRADFNTLERYYGPGYERGDWPGIYGAIRALQHLMPDATVYYGSDADEDGGSECTDEYLAEMWAHWLSADGDAYRRL